MKKLLLLSITATGLCAAQVNNATLSLSEAIDIALTQPTPADADAAVAQARLAWLEASSQRRMEIRPQSAIWTLVNPVALATNVGAGLLANGKTATPLNVLDARIDSAAAAVEVQRHRFQREVEVTEKYMALALQQQAANQACQMVSEALDQRAASEQELEVARATRLDVLWQAQAVLEQKSVCRRGDQAVEIAALALSSLVHRSVEDVQATEIRVDTPSDLPLESAEALYDLARVYRQDLAAGQLAKQRIVALWDELEATHDKRARIVLKDNGSFEAEKRLMAEKIRRLESHTSDLERQIQERIREVRIRISSLHDQLELAEQRRVLATEQSQATEARLLAGLADRRELARVKSAEQQATFDVARLKSEDTANVAALVAVVGLGDEDQSRHALVYDATVVSARLR